MNNNEKIEISIAITRYCISISSPDTSQPAIAEDAFPRERECNEHIVPESVTELCSTNFMYCDSLKRIVLHKNLCYINEGSFYGCINLCSFDVAEDNPCYTSIDGVLFDKTKTTLLAYPPGKKAAFYKIPYGVKRISKGAFANCKYLEDLIVPETVVSAGEWFFEGTFMRIHCNENSIVRKHFGDNPSESEMEIISEHNRRIRNGDDSGI